MLPLFFPIFPLYPYLGKKQLYPCMYNVFPFLFQPFRCRRPIPLRSPRAARASSARCVAWCAATWPTTTVTTAPSHATRAGPFSGGPSPLMLSMSARRRMRKTSLKVRSKKVEVWILDIETVKYWM